GGDCRSNASPGDYLLFFAGGDPKSVLAAHYFGVSDATAEVTAEALREVSEASGQTANTKAPWINGVIATGLSSLAVIGAYSYFFFPLFISGLVIVQAWR